MSIAAVTKGAMAVEKHFTLSRMMYGSDTKHSEDPETFTQFVSQIRELDQALEHPVNKDKLARALKSMKLIYEKSIVAARNLKRGKKLTLGDLAFNKPGKGESANQFKYFIGKTLAKGIKKDNYVYKKDLK